MTKENIEKKSAFPDRANLTPDQSLRLEKWAEQIKEAVPWLLKVSKSDLVNFMLEKIADRLPEQTIVEINARFFDEAKWLTWATGQLRQAKANGGSLSLDDLLKRRGEIFEGSLSNSGKRSAPEMKKKSMRRGIKSSVSEPSNQNANKVSQDENEVATSLDQHC